MKFNHQIFTTFVSLLLIHTVAFAETYPSPPSPNGRTTELKTKAGYGSDIAYAEAGVVELGGSLSWVSANNFDQFSLSPSVGWFVVDNLELSGIVSYNHASTANNDVTYWTALVEPSFHMPFSKVAFGFVGLGIGAAYSNEIDETGFAFQPRIGGDFLIGRSGIIKPSLFYAVNALDTDAATPNGIDTVSIDELVGINVSYSVLF